MRYYLKRLGKQELGSVKNGKPQRGRYILISKSEALSGVFPPLSEIVKNDSAVIPVVPLYLSPFEKVYCNFVYHNEKHSVAPEDWNGQPRDEYRLYCNKALEEDTLLFQPEDILIFRAMDIKKDPSSDLPDSVIGKIYLLYRCCDHNSSLYKKCEEIMDDSPIRGKGHALYEGYLDAVESQIDAVDFDSLGIAIDESVTAKAQKGDIGAMSSLFNSVSFRDFVMTGYNFECAITRRVIRYGTFMNLEAAHIWPRSHQGLYMPSNGIALCRDMHWAFDKGMFTVDDDYCVRVHPDITSEYLMQYNRQKLYVPDNEFFQPDINNLHYHQTNVYGLFKTAGSLMKANGYYGNSE